MSCERRRGVPPRPQPAGHAGRAARRGQRGACGPAPRAEPLGDEPDAGAPARDHGRPAAGAGGRGLVPTPRALELRERVGRLVQDAEAVLRPAAEPDLARLERTFTLRTSEGFVENFGPELIARVGAEAPRVRLRFVPEARQGGSAAPRRAASTWRPAWSSRRPARSCARRRCSATAWSASCARASARAAARSRRARYAEGPAHLRLARGTRQWPIDDALAALGLERDVVTVVGGFATAVGARPGVGPGRQRPGAPHGEPARRDAQLPAAGDTPEFTVSLLWHPRLDADPAHRWLRGVVRAACGAPSR